MRLRRSTVILAIAAPFCALYLLLEPDGWVFGPNLRPLFLLVDADAAVRLASGPLGNALVVAGVFGAVTYAVVRFWLWSRARHGRGARLLFCAAVLGPVPVLLQAFVFVLSTPWGNAVSPPGWLLILVAHGASVWGWLVAPLVLFLMGVGLLRARLVSPWVAAAAIVASILFAVDSAQTGAARAVLGQASFLDALPIQMYQPAVIAEVVCLMGAGVSLVWRELRPPIDAPILAGPAAEQALQPGAPKAGIES